MFKVGDSVVCIDNSGNPYIFRDHIYTVTWVYHDFDIDVNDELSRPVRTMLYNKNNFISVKEYRKSKINKLLSKMNIK